MQLVAPQHCSCHYNYLKTLKIYFCPFFQFINWGRGEVGAEIAGEQT